MTGIQTEVVALISNPVGFPGSSSLILSVFNCFHPYAEDVHTATQNLLVILVSIFNMLCRSPTFGSPVEKEEVTMTTIHSQRHWSADNQDGAPKPMLERSSGRYRRCTAASTYSVCSTYVTSSPPALATASSRRTISGGGRRLRAVTTGALVPLDDGGAHRGLRSRSSSKL